jgi:hypothetical protein
MRQGASIAVVGVGMLRNKSKLMGVRPPYGRHARPQEPRSRRHDRERSQRRARLSGQVEWQAGRRRSSGANSCPISSTAAKTPSALGPVVGWQTQPSLKRHAILWTIRDRCYRPSWVAINGRGSPVIVGRSNVLMGLRPRFPRARPEFRASPRRCVPARYEVWSSTGNRGQATAHPCSAIWTA